ncbi:MAG: class I SAM-dependent methyltransferase, partial [Candidatus Aenigmarchaeota archaeon]|nr:class I SAM-dependent methyltransferase [Candidatus Aenigmarchaeota archaeon]
MMVEKELQKSEFDMFASEFERTRQKPWAEVTDFLDSFAEDSFVLDIGAGGGRHAGYAAQRHRVVALDISRKMIQIARGKRAHCVVAGAEQIPFESKSFDAVTYVASIHHIRTEEGRRNSLKEIKRVLVPKGRFIVSAWARDQKKFAAFVDENGDIEHTWDGMYARFYHLFCEDELLGLVKDAGFKGVRG